MPGYTQHMAGAGIHQRRLYRRRTNVKTEKKHIAKVVNYVQIKVCFNFLPCFAFNLLIVAVFLYNFAAIFSGP